MPETLIPAPLVPASDLAATNTAHFPNESPEYRAARNALLAQEIELRRALEAVAAQRRALPPGGELPQDYTFDSETGPINFSDLFGDKETLVLYSYMFGPQRERPCPMCTAVLTSWDGAARNLHQRIALGVVARSPIERLVAFKHERGWQNLRLFSDTTGDYTRAYVSADDADVPGVTIFSRSASGPNGEPDGVIRHFWSGEIAFNMADPGQDPRSAPEIDPLWTVLVLTPEGRAPDWYPQLEYTAAPSTCCH